MSEETLYATGFDAALLGIGVQFNKELAIYDYSKCIEILIQDGMTSEEADEWMSYNVLGSYVGEHTPIFLMPKEYNL